MNIYLDLFLTFAKVGVCTFGGGYAMLPILQREIVDGKHWATDEELNDYFAIGQCTPGIIAVNTATFIGCRLKKAPGGIIATLGVVFPSIVIITVIAACLSNFQDSLIVQHAFAGIRACVCILILNAVLKLRKSSIIDLPTAILFALVFAASAAFGLSPALLVITCGLIGLGLSRFRNEHPQTSGDNPTAPTEVAHASGEQSASDPSQTSADAQSNSISQVPSDTRATK
ncbi:MAG: chromate transporter [Proteobacteria bacterium]|nr:chromate transporter [Pseudomonadota bacterium]